MNFLKLTFDCYFSKQKKTKEKPIKLAVAPSENDPSERVNKKDKPKRKEGKNKFKVQDQEVSSSTDVDSLSTLQNLTSRLKNYKPRKHSVLKAEGTWYEQHVHVSIQCICAFEIL